MEISQRLYFIHLFYLVSDSASESFISNSLSLFSITGSTFDIDNTYAPFSACDSASASRVSLSLLLLLPLPLSFSLPLSQILSPLLPRVLELLFFMSLHRFWHYNVITLRHLIPYLLSPPPPHYKYPLISFSNFNFTPATHILQK